MSFADILNQLNKKKDGYETLDLAAETASPLSANTDAPKPVRPQPGSTAKTQSSHERLEDAIQLFESIREIVGEDGEFIRIPCRAALIRLPLGMRGPNWNLDSIPDNSINLETQPLLEQLRTGKIVYRLEEIKAGLPEAWIVAEDDEEIELDLATVYSSVPPKLIAVSSQISDAMEQILAMPDYFSAKPDAIDETPTAPPAAPHTARAPIPTADEPASRAAAEPIVESEANVASANETDQEEPVSDQSKLVAATPEARQSHQVLRPAQHRSRFTNPWSGRETGSPLASPTDLNTASAGELAELPGLGSKRAEAIIRYRVLHSGLESIYDLLSIPGIGTKNFRDMTGLDPEQRADRNLVLRKLLEIPGSKRPLVSDLTDAAARKFNADGCILAGDDGIIISKSTNMPTDHAKHYAALAPKIFRGTRKYLAQIEGLHSNMFALPGSNPPLVFVGLSNFYLVLALKPQQNLSTIAKDIAVLSEEIDWLFSRRAVVGE